MKKPNSNKRRSKKSALLLSALSLLLSTSMLVGSTFAWFTDSVTSTGNIVQSGTLDVQMLWADGDLDPNADETTWEDASKGAIFNYTKWEPGYVQARHLKITNTGDLALKYQMRIIANGVVSELADVIDVYFFDSATKVSRDTSISESAKLGTLSDVLTKPSNSIISTKVTGTLKENEAKTVTLVLKMRENAGNEYQDLSIGSDFSVQLLATQETYEKDSFDKLYDNNADYDAQEVPQAMVYQINSQTAENINIIDQSKNHLGTGLDTAYSFQPTETYEQALSSEYSWAHADFFVYADNDVPANSMMLAGYYSLFGDFLNIDKNTWIGLTADVDVLAGEEHGIRLLGDGMGLSIAYNEICNYGNDGTGFLCGATDVTGQNAGTTLTVELRLYKVACSNAGCHHNSADCETGDYITVGKFTYTFPGEATASTAWENLDVVAGDVTRSNQIAKDYVEICHKSGNLTLENVTFENGLTVYSGPNATGTVTMENCTIKLSNGVPTNTSYNMCYADYGMYIGAISSNVSYTFKNCTFTANNTHTYTNSDKGYNVYIGGNYSADSITFENCTFEKSSKHGIGCSFGYIPDEANNVATYYNLTVTGCNFIDWNNGNYDGAAIRGNVPADILTTYSKSININGNTFGNNNESKKANVAIDGWTGTWN